MDRSQPLRSLYHTRPVRIGAAGDLRQRQLYLPGARRRVDHLRDGARHANHPLDGRPHVGSGIKQYLGDARGRFEADTLVVETTNFLGNTTGVGGNGGGAPTSDALGVVERFTRVAPDVLNYEVAIDDPKTFTRPFKLVLPLTTQPGYQVLPYECHEGNLALHNILSAARAEERAIEEAVRKGLPRPQPSVWLGGLAPGAPDQ